MPSVPEISYKVPIPAGVTVTVDAKTNHTTVKGPKGTLARPFRSRDVRVRVDGSQVVVEKELPRRKEKAMVGTYAAHIQNMIKGVTNGWTYTMKAVFNHFPIKMTVHGDEFHVENFLGERAPRVARIAPGVKITVKGADVTLEGVDLAVVSQTAANIEGCTKIRNKDVRVFQDGVYITKKGE
jgi:large subunit ribosomal protein L6